MGNGLPSEVWFENVMLVPSEPSETVMFVSEISPILHTFPAKPTGVFALAGAQLETHCLVTEIRGCTMVT